MGRSCSESWIYALASYSKDPHHLHSYLHHPHHHHPPFTGQHDPHSPSTLLFFSDAEVALIPYQVLMRHPLVGSMQAEIEGHKRRIDGLEHANMQLASSNAELANKFAQSSTSSIVSGKIIVNGEDLSCVPETPLEKLPNPHLMLWTQEDAQKELGGRYGREAIIRMKDGQIMDKEDVRPVAKMVAKACTALDALKWPAHIAHKARTLENFKNYFLADVLRVCKSLERDYPPFSYCTMHYKPMKWMERYYKSKNETEAKLERAYKDTIEPPPAKRARTSAASASAATSSDSKGKGKGRAATPAPAPTQSMARPKPMRSQTQAGYSSDSDLNDGDEDLPVANARRKTRDGFASVAKDLFSSQYKAFPLSLNH
ncbi:hypothetical protein V8E36_009300 [Tilletia maclaganii]